MESLDHQFRHIQTNKKVDDEKIEEGQQPRCEKPSHKRQNYQKSPFNQNIISENGVQGKPERSSKE